MRPTASATLPDGSVFHGYRLVRTVGCGGMAAVYEAVRLDGRRRVALKLLHPGLRADAEARGRFLREGEAASRLNHPHVVDVSEVGVHDGTPYMVMEFLQGETLADFLSRNRALPAEIAVDLLLPVLAAVWAAHAEGIVHRDIKPENVFLVDNGNGTVCPKLLDFGISKLADSRHALVLTAGGGTRLLGTPYYMAPEQIMGEGAVDARADQYALGVILYESLVGRGPFAEQAVYSLLRDIVESRFAPPTAFCPTIPRALESMTLRAMRKEPERRYSSVHEFGRALLPFASESGRALWEPVFGRPSLVPNPPANETGRAKSGTRPTAGTARESTSNRSNGTGRASDASGIHRKRWFPFARWFAA